MSRGKILKIFFCTLVATFVVWAGQTSAVRADIFYPDDRTVVASWEAGPEEKPELSSLKKSLDEARSLNGSGLALRRIIRITNAVISSGNFEPEMLLFKARLQQHQHAFIDAASTIRQYTEKYGKTPSAQLLQATIAINLGKSDEAEAACRSLAGTGEPALSAICLLDIRSQQSPDLDDYKKLEQLHQYSGVAKSAPLDGWLREILASLALELNHPEEASAWLDNVDFNQVPLSRVALWADIQLALGQPDRVLNTLSPIINDPDNVDDAIMLRLAQAEKLSKNGTLWTQAMAQRVAMRAWRDDGVHAAQLARYYLDIQPDPLKALKYARLNWEHGKTRADKILLERAVDSQIESEEK